MPVMRALRGAFSGPLEVLKIKLADLDKLTMPNEPLTTPPPYEPQRGDIILDTSSPDQVTVTGPWQSSDKDTARYGKDYLFLRPSDAGQIKFHIQVPTDGNYEIFALWNDRGHRSKNVPYNIVHADGKKTISIDQNVNGGTWNSLGKYRLTPEGSSVDVTIESANDFMVVDAILVAPRP